MRVVTDDESLVSTGTPDKKHTILQMNFAQSLYSLVMSLPSVGSLTHAATVCKNDGGRACEVVFDKLHPIGRYELTIDNTNLKIGNEVTFVVEYLDGSCQEWKLLGEDRVVR